MNKKKQNTKQMSDEISELRDLFEEVATPRKEFVENLKPQVVSHANTNKSQSNFITYLFMKLSQSTLKVGAVVALLAIGAGAASYQYWYQPRPFANQDEILAQIAQANANVKRDSSSAAKPMALSTEGDAKISSLLIRTPEDRDYNYKTITTTYQVGSAYNKCLQMVPYNGAVTKDTNVEYFSTKDEAWPKYTKYVVYNGNDIYDYVLTVDTDQWVYKGGSYGVHLKNVARIMPLAMTQGIPENVKSDEVVNPPTETPSELVNPSMPITTTVQPTETELPTPTTNPKDVIKNYFGEDAKVLGKLQKDGKDYYKIQWSYTAFCGDISAMRDVSVSSSDSDQKVFDVALVDVKDMSIDSESIYLDSVSNRNLLYERTTSESKKNISDYSEIASEFTFAETPNVKTVDASAYQYEKEYRKAVLSYLEKAMTSVVYMTGKYTLQSLSASNVTVVPDHEKHLVDRDFYSQKSFGEAQYNDAKDMFKPYTQEGKTNPLVQLSYSGSGTLQWVSMSEFPATIQGIKALTELGLEEKNLKAGTSVNVMVNGEVVNAQIFETVQQPVADPGTGSGSSGISLEEYQKTLPGDPVYKDLYIVFQAGDKTVVLQSSTNSKVAVADIAKQLVFASVATSNASALNKALTVVSSPDTKPDLMAR